MAKSLLILMLVTTQLLAGSGGSFHLCFCRDGAGCCIDTGPASCNCCHKHDEASHSAPGTDQACLEDPVAACCEHCTDGAAKPGYEESLIGDPCGCTHIPVASADQTTTAVRSSMVREVERLAQRAGWTPRLSGADDFAISPHLRRGEPPWIPDFRLTMVSTVVIRC